MAAANPKSREANSLSAARPPLLLPLLLLLLPLPLLLLPLLLLPLLQLLQLLLLLPLARSRSPARTASQAIAARLPPACARRRL
jgi:hypothetical protein